MTVESEDLYPDVEVKVVDGFYQATLTKRFDNGFKYNEDITLPAWGSRSHGNHFTIGDATEFYAGELNVAQLVAAHKIFFDRWTFVSGTVFDHQFMLACEKELKRRRANELTHSHMPAHTHAINNIGGPQSFGMTCTVAGPNGTTMTVSAASQGHGVNGGHSHSHLPFNSHFEPQPWKISAEAKSPI